MSHFDRRCAHRSRRTVVVLLAIIGIVGLTAGFLSETPLSQIPVVRAACGWAFNCAGGDDTATSVLNVSHGKTNGEYVIPVEPDDGETWHIDATWSSDTSAPLGCTCLDLVSAGVYADVTWSDQTGWSVSCRGCNYLYGPIRQVSICHTAGCGSGQVVDNGWGYKLLVDINHTRGLTCPDTQATYAYLSSVTYTTTSVDDGDVINWPQCTEGTAVSPTSQTWSQTDTGAFECGVSCDNGGPSLAILYE